MGAQEAVDHHCRKCDQRDGAPVLGAKNGITSYDSLQRLYRLIYIYMHIYIYIYNLVRALLVG